MWYLDFYDREPVRPSRYSWYPQDDGFDELAPIDGLCSGSLEALEALVREIHKAPWRTGIAATRISKEPRFRLPRLLGEGDRCV